MQETNASAVTSSKGNLACNMKLLLCAFAGPLYLGLYNDIQIFCQGLIYILDDGERIEADKGYTVSIPCTVKYPPVLIVMMIDNG